jgi:hypothetical protein
MQRTGISVFVRWVESEVLYRAANRYQASRGLRLIRRRMTSGKRRLNLLHYCKMGDSNRQHVYLRLYTYRLGGVAVLRLHGFFTSCSIIVACNDGHIVILLDAHVSMPSTAVHSPCLTWSLPQPLTLEEYWRKIHIILRRRQFDWNHLPCRWAWLSISCLIDCRSRYS